ncbi:MAG: hypothetical protein AAB284_04510, partial [Chloroflexota bacterium]
MDVIELLTFTRDQGASDLHLSAGVPPMVRVHGDITPLEERVAPGIRPICHG